MKNINNQWLDIEYLQSGDQVQAEVYQLLSKHKILQLLQRYKPILVGTVPIGINIDTSDLDIICEVKDFVEFERLVKELFNDQHGFTISRKVVEGIERITVNFQVEDWPIEIFGQNKPTTLQNGLLHMIIEDRMLNMYGKKFKERIIQLKSEGLKTEPAFAKALNLLGNPYLKLLELMDCTKEQLRVLWKDSDDIA
ncbi:hypothetical protein D3C81_812670 [compost metagenome]